MLKESIVSETERQREEMMNAFSLRLTDNTHVHTQLLQIFDLCYCVVFDYLNHSTYSLSRAFLIFSIAFDLLDNNIMFR
jgi:hypothetical protein